MSIFSRFNKLQSGIDAIIIGAILTGVALVIANAWGKAIQKTISLLVNKVRCQKYLVLDNKKEYEECEKSESIESLYINAIMTSVILYIIIISVFGKNSINKMKK